MDKITERIAELKTEAVALAQQNEQYLAQCQQLQQLHNENNIKRLRIEGAVTELEKLLKPKTPSDNEE